MTLVDVFVTVWIAMFVGHGIGDRWFQTDRQALTKGERTAAGRWACAAHCLTYTAATATLTAAVWLAFGLHITVLGFIAGQLVSAVTHFWADRRFTLRWLIEHFAPWKRTYYDKVPGGAEHLDQTFHWFCLLIAALLTAVIR